MRESFFGIHLDVNPIAFRVASRFHTLRVASLVDDFRHKMVDLLGDSPISDVKGKALATWLTDNFYILSPKTPRGQKVLKELMTKLHWFLNAGISMHSNPTSEKGLRDTLEDIWSKVEPQLDALTKYFSSEGGKVVPKDLKVEGHTFINSAGLEEEKLQEYAGRLLAIFKDLKGWRQKALTGGVKVLFASPADMGGGTAGGRYKSNEDTLMVRTTPSVLKRSGTSYGGFEYIITHELGHRYERKYRQAVDFDRPEWWTTPYSRNEGESFAELFALTNFGITSAHTTWSPELNEKFEQVLTTGKVEEKPELPPHLRKIIDQERANKL